MAGPGRQAGGRASDGATRGGMGTRGAAVVIGVAGLFGAIIFALLKQTADWLVRPPLDSVVLLVAGFVTVALVLLVGSVVMTALGMRTPTQALGMPAGSIRALIAMVLILIFAIIGILVFNSGTSPETFESTGITQNQIDAIRAGGGIVLEQDLIAVPSPAPGASPVGATYTVRIRPRMTQESHDFGLQLMTTVSTLVVAVAGFYFGSKSVEQAVAAAKDFRPPERPAPPLPDLIPPRPERPRDEDGTEEPDAGAGGDGGTDGDGPDDHGTVDLGTHENGGTDVGSHDGGTGDLGTAAVPRDTEPATAAGTGEPASPEPLPAEDPAKAKPAIETVNSLDDTRP